MLFTLDEIKNYLFKCGSLDEAIFRLTEPNVTNCNDYPAAFNYERNEYNLERYERQIGMLKLREEQLLLRRDINGTKGKYWLALSPKWIEKDRIGKRQTEYDIIYWVNYGDNEVYGWFTVEQIKKWLTEPETKLSTLK